MNHWISWPDQDLSVQDMAPAALINLVLSGEIPLSPTILCQCHFDQAERRARGMASSGAGCHHRRLGGFVSQRCKPHTALLFIDFLLSKERRQLLMKGGLWSPREDVGS
jgi:hypothetical protein